MASTEGLCGSQSLLWGWTWSSCILVDFNKPYLSAPWAKLLHEHARPAFAIPTENNSTIKTFHFLPAASVSKGRPLWRIYIGTDRRYGDWRQINLLLGAFRDVSAPLVTHAARVDHCGYEKHICRPWDRPWNELTTKAVQSGGEDGNSSWPDVGPGQLPKRRPIILEQTLHLHTGEGEERGRCGKQQVVGVGGGSRSFTSVPPSECGTRTYSCFRQQIKKTPT